MGRRSVYKSLKARTLVSCILFIILLILLLSTAAQATEYREDCYGKKVNASDILTHIEKGDNINLINCSIVGEFNVSKIITTSNPVFSKLSSKTHSEDGIISKTYKKDEIISYGINENLIVIESNITIINSTFKDSFDFSNVQFNNVANFVKTNFNSSANFNRANFNNSTDFNGANFYNSVNFNRANFNNSTDFNGAKFYNSVNFNRANFNNSTDFNGAKFYNSVNFNETNFNSYTNFSSANFDGNIYFKCANFNSSANFHNATFTNYAGFYYAKFDGPADFSRAKFLGETSFWIANFNRSANFSSAEFKNSYTSFQNANFNSDVNFLSANFNGKTEFRRANFSKITHFCNMTINSSVYFTGPETSKNIITDNNTRHIFVKFYKDEARYDDADNIYYNYRNRLRVLENYSERSKWEDSAGWISWGYGVRPLYTLIMSISIIILFAFIYKNPNMYLLYWLFALQLVDLKLHFLMPNEYRSKYLENRYESLSLKLNWGKAGIYRKGENGTEQITSDWEFLYFSVNIFTRLGSADCHPTDSFRRWVTIEAFLGWLLLALLFATTAAHPRFY